MQVELRDIDDMIAKLKSRSFLEDSDFMSMKSMFTDENEQKEELLFNNLDMGNDSAIDGNDLLKYLMTLPEYKKSPLLELTKLVRQLIEECDSNGDDVLSFEEFVSKIDYLSKKIGADIHA